MSGRELPGLIRAGALRVNGTRVPLLSGEIQFFRMDPGTWEPALLQLKAAGLPMVSTYLSWRRFSTGPDAYDLEGRTDPRLDAGRFLELCRKHGLWVTLKPGPWICAEEAGGGYPDWLVAKPELQVLDSHGAAVQGYNPPFQSPIPSYLHPVYLGHLGRWLSEVDRKLARFFHPRGPILLVQLDNEPSLTFHDRLLESDYNPVNVGPGGLYHRWLERKYGTIDGLNRAHGSSWTAFSQVPAPRAFMLSRREDLGRLTDWAEFKEDLMTRHIECIREMHEQNGLHGVLFTINYNEHPQVGVPNNWHALELASGMGGFDFYPRMPLSESGVADIALFAAYSRACNVLPWSPEIMTGTWSFPGQEHRPGDLSVEDYRYLYLCCVAFGIKGMNFYMFADRDNWIDSPLDSSAAPTPTLAAVTDVVKLIAEEPELEGFTRSQDVAVLYSRAGAREAFIADAAGCPVSFDGRLLGSSYACFKRLFGQLHRLNVDPAIIDPEIDPGALRRYRLVFVPGPVPATVSDLTAGGAMMPVDPGRMPSDSELRRILEEAGVRPGVTADAPGVLTVLHERGPKQWLFVINTNGKATAVELCFRGTRARAMTALSGADGTVEIKASRARLACGPRAVQVWRLEG